MDPSPIRDLLARVRSRWRRLLVFQATTRAALAAVSVLGVALLLAGWTDGAPLALALLGATTLVLMTVAFVWGAWPAREVPTDARVARFIEERNPSLDDRLVSGVDLLGAEDGAERSALAGPIMADADRAASAIDPASVLSGDLLRRAGIQAVAAALLLAVVAFTGRGTAHQAFDALTLALFPSRLSLEVVPGNARIAVGTPLTIEARLVGNRAPVIAQLLRSDLTETNAETVREKPDTTVRPKAGAADIDDGSEWQAVEMTTDSSGAFRFQLEAVPASFRYRVVAGTITSPIFDVHVARPPRVTRVDVEYHFPTALGLAPQTEEDSGDVYAPAGTEVRIRAHVDRPSLTGQLTLGDGKTVALATVPPVPPVSSVPGRVAEHVLMGTLQVIADNSYRIALADTNGLKNPGDTEYFIRTVEDRAPEVHVRKPARDRSVTMLEEVQIEADAEDDFGIDRLELVYAVRGAAERVVPLRIPPQAASVSATHMFYLEELGVRPGDFVSYYVRARDRGRGRRSTEGRSDIFFLEVKAFEQEFVMARSLASGSGNVMLDDLVSAQKEVIVATWKLDRRSQVAGAKSEQDIRAVAQAEAELKKRVEETSSSFRESNLRDPRQRAPQPGRGQPDAPRAGQTRPEEDAMTAAATAMGKAVAALNGLRTGPAIPPEMEALNYLLRAQADVKRLQVSRQQAGNGAGNRSTQDMSSLFDRELQREQQTNYETPATTEQRDNTNLANKVKELARRQDELNQRQQAADRMSAEERRRELEKLTRDQTELRQKAEELTRQIEREQGSRGSRGSQGSQGSRGSVGSQGSRSSQGSQTAQGSQGSRSGQQMRSVSEEMRNAAGDLQRQDARQASARGARAVQRLQELERQLRTSGPDERRRALGEMQLEARQIADAERQIASELNRLQGSQGSRGLRGSQGSQGLVNRDTLRRLAGEQERLADRARQVQRGLDEQAAAIAGSTGGGNKDDLQRAVGAAAADLNRQRPADRMQQAAEQLRAAAGQANDQQANDQAAKAAAAQEAVARDLDSLADKLADAQTPTDEASRRLADQRTRAQELREDINRLTSEIEKLGQQSNTNSGQPSPGDAGRSGQGQAGTGGRGSELARLRQEYAQRLKETRDLLDQMRREDPSFSQGGPGLTLEGRGMTLSAPGTEAFKQDFAKWEQLRQQASLLLTQAESSISQRLLTKMAKDRLAAGAGDRAPAEYQKQVDEYFKTLATQKR